MRNNAIGYARLRKAIYDDSKSGRPRQLPEQVRRLTACVSALQLLINEVGVDVAVVWVVLVELLIETGYTVSVVEALIDWLEATYP